MNCNEIKDLFSLYIDDELSYEERLLVEEHLLKCEDCRNELEEYKKIIQALNEIPEEEPPSGYCKRLHEKLLIAEAAKPVSDDEVSKNIVKAYVPKKTTNNKFKWVKYGGLAAALVLVFLVYGFNNLRMGNSKYSKSEEIAYDTNSAAPAAEAPYAPAQTKNESYEYFAVEEEKGKTTRGIDTYGAEDSAYGLMQTETREMKVIKSGSISVETDDYEKFLDELSATLQSMGGFLESNNTEVYQVYENEKLMYGNLMLRVPEESFYILIEYLDESSEVRRKSINETDVTKEYYEKDNRVKNLEVQEEHLRELFDKAQTVEEMLLIENELRRIRTEIDALNISLSDIDDRASMSTLNLEVQEVLTANFEITNKESVWERAKEGFINTVNGIIRAVENLIIYIVSNSPVLIPAVIIFIVVLVKFRKYRKKKL